MSYQQRINFLRQEVNVVNRTIDAQSKVFNCILSSGRDESSLAAPRHLRLNRARLGEQAEGRATYREPESLRSHLRFARNRYAADDDMNVLLEPIAEVSDFYKLPSTDAAGFRDLLAAECTQLLERRNRDFDEYAEQAGVLEQTVSCPDRVSSGAGMWLLTQTPEPEQRGSDEGQARAGHLRFHHRHHHLLAP